MTAPGYRTSPSGRRLGIGMVAALHLMLLLLGLEARHVAPVAAASRDSGALSAIALLPGISAPSVELSTLAADVPLPQLNDPQAAVPSTSAAPSASLSSEIAAAVSDDPGGEDSEQRYRALLLRHIARYRAYPPAMVRAAGMVVVRFRIARTGDIVDARIVATQGALLDEAALATLWRAEPLPDVPAGLTVPWEVDIPIDFARSARG